MHIKAEYGISLKEALMEQGLDAEEELARILQDEILKEYAFEQSAVAVDPDVATLWKKIGDLLEDRNHSPKPFGLTPVKDD